MRILEFGILISDGVSGLGFAVARSHRLVSCWVDSVEINGLQDFLPAGRCLTNLLNF
jgi:hypothetical protein